MSSDDNTGALRAPSRGFRSLSDVQGRNVSTTAPVLPPLRSSSARQPYAPTNRTVSAISRLSDQQLNRYHVDPDPELEPEPWDLVNWEEYGTEERPNGRYYSAFVEAADSGRRSMLRAYLDSTQPVPPVPDLLATLTAQRQELLEDSRRSKRRKLDSDRLSPNFQGFQYGKYGQVEPGHLTMELVSCDGGSYSDDTTRYAPENILADDNSVYCTEGSRCNIVLRHQGSTVFTLKELVVKAPRSNFTSPIQAGMVFVSMSCDHILKRTAQYQIQYSPYKSSLRRTDGEESTNPILSIRHNEDGSTITRARARRLHNIWLEDERGGVAQIPSEFNVSPSPFQVTTECSDEDWGEPGDRWRRAPNRIGALPFESDSSDDEDNYDELDDYSASGTDYRSRRRRDRAGTALAEAEEAAQIATQEAVRAVGGELMAPHARFHIERHKNMCTIRFDPPISGRFILLKMWNPRRSPHGNIDVRAVIAKGYAGPRFFPSIELC
ncbi:hypothetical protein F4777DRAFT_556647 [Nemania sp. FL0916]|nr:hypothetical protein F4777DRAFT_556647 [Nemania sp. FL0916]